MLISLNPYQVLSSEKNLMIFTLRDIIIFFCELDYSDINVTMFFSSIEAQGLADKSSRNHDFI